MVSGQLFDRLNFFDISVVSGIRPCGRSVDRLKNGRKQHGFLYVWRGEATFYVRDEAPLVVTEGKLFYLPKGERYRMTYTAESTTFVVVNFQIAAKDEENVALFACITELMKDSGIQQIAKLMTSFELSSASKDVSAVLRKKELLYRLLGMIYTAKPMLSAGSAENLPILDGVLLLERTYMENLPISEYAAASHISVNTFRRLFQKQFGMPPIPYRNRLRIERARELLSEGSFTVAEVAYAVGFETVGYFCRYYRQVTGESPSETKKKSHWESL